MKYLKLSILLICFACLSCLTDKKETNTNSNETSEEFINEDVKPDSTSDKMDSKVGVIPINHGTLVLEYESVVLYVDPVGGAEAFKDQKPPTLILITDIHGDHLSVETIEEISTESSKIIAPIAVAEKLPKDLSSKASILSNFQSKDYMIGTSSIAIEAIPMYNLREEALKFHPKNRGNGYVLTLGSERVYISGDTEDIPEMRQLKDIDIAFVCMNLPYTMTVESAADAVLEFKPKKVYPYHYRGTNGFSDVKKFKSIINERNKSIQVIQDEWY